MPTSHPILDCPSSSVREGGVANASDDAARRRSLASRRQGVQAAFMVVPWRILARAEHGTLARMENHSLGRCRTRRRREVGHDVCLSTNDGVIPRRPC